MPRQDSHQVSVSPSHPQITNRRSDHFPPNKQRPPHSGKKAWYNNKIRILHFVIGSEDDHGLVDGATTDRVLGILKNGKISDPEFSTAEEKILRGVLRPHRDNRRRRRPRPPH